MALPSSRNLLFREIATTGGSRLKSNTYYLEQREANVFLYIKLPCKRHCRVYSFEVLPLFPRHTYLFFSHYSLLITINKKFSSKT
ncbi:hypothetical protein BH23BAC1_BH23BAC1_37570 [soil metagenome]